MVWQAPMDRLAAILLAVSGTVALQVLAQAVVLASVRLIGRRTRGATEIRRTFWISLGAVVPLFFGHFAQVGLWAGFLVLLGALQTYDDAIYFSLVTFARWVTAISFWRRATAFLARSGPLVVR